MSVASNEVAAHFRVDVASGHVSISNSSTASKNSRSIFTGTAVSFNSGTLFNLPGNNGTKVLSVSLTNNSGLPIGNGIGADVVFSNFANVGSFPDVRSLTNVSTVAGGFNSPKGVVSAGNGVLYVSDTSNNQIKKVSQGVSTIFAGSGSPGNSNGVSSAASFNLPLGLAVLNGNLIVADYGSNAIRQISASGSVTTLASGLQGPWGVATDGAGNIYFTERGASDLKRISNGIVSVFAGGTPGKLDGVGSSAQLYNPEGLAYANGFLYVADYGNNSIRQVSVTTGSVVTIAGNGALGVTDGAGSNATFYHPTGVTTAGNAVIVAENNYYYDSDTNLRQITPIQGGSGSTSASWQTSTIAGVGFDGSYDGPGTVASFDGPNLLSSDASGNIYVADTVNNEIRIVTPDNGVFPVGVPKGGTPNTELVQLANATGQMDSIVNGLNIPYISYPGTFPTGTSSPSQPWWFSIPAGVNVFEFDVTVQADLSGPLAPGGGSNSGDPSEIVSTLAGNYDGYGFLDGPTTQARFGKVLYITGSPSGLYVADNLNQTIDLVSYSGMVSTIAGAPGRTKSDGLGSIAGFAYPAGIGIDSTGNLYVPDGSVMRIMQYDHQGSITNPASWTVSTIAPTGTFNNPAQAVVDSSGNVFVTDFGNNNVRMFHPNGGDLSQLSNWTVSTFAGSTTGQSGSTNGTGTAASFYQPYGLAIDPNGTLYVSEYGNNTIRKITRDGVVTLVAGKTQVFGYVDGSGPNSRLNQPKNMVCDSAGYLYFVDETLGGGVPSTDTVLRRLSPGGVVSTVAGQVAEGNTPSDGPGNNALFFDLYSVTINANGDLFVGDGGSIREIQKQISVGVESLRK